MKIRSKLALNFASATALVLLIILGSVYYFSEKSRQKEFYRTLTKEAITKANLVLNHQVDPEVMQLIYQNNRELINEIEVAVYNLEEKMIYHDAVEIDIVKETPQMFEEIIKHDTIRFRVGNYEGIGLKFELNQQTYLVTAAAYDGYGLAKQRTLALILLSSALLNIIILFILSYYFAKAALKPMRNIVNQVRHITVSRLKLRVPVINPKDELGELSITFNEMLDRLQYSFQSQRHLMNSISHELRTPLAALIAELDIALLQATSPEEFKLAITNALNDTNDIIKLTNGLLDLAKSGYLSDQVNVKPVRVDELLVDARSMILKSNTNYKIDLIFEELPEEEDHLTVNANGYLLRTAFCNLIENNCKFSDNHRSLIQVSVWDKNIYIKFSDTGHGIPKELMSKIFEPFYRAPNNRHIKGYGIGMALCQRVFKQFNGTLTVLSEVNVGTTFSVELPHI